MSDIIAEHIKGLKTARDYETSNLYHIEQYYQIVEGLNSGVDVSVYHDPSINQHHMKQIRFGLEDKLDMSIWSDPTVYNPDQMFQMRLGLMEGLDISVYADRNLDNSQMYQLRLGLIKGVDVESYNYTALDTRQMANARRALEKELAPKPTPQSSARTIEQIKDTGLYSEKQLQQLIKGQEAGVDISVYASHGFSEEQMEEIRLGLQAGIRVVDVFDTPHMRPCEMKVIREALVEQKAMQERVVRRMKQSFKEDNS